MATAKSNSDIGYFKCLTLENYIPKSLRSARCVTPRARSFPECERRSCRVAAHVHPGPVAVLDIPVVLPLALVRRVVQALREHRLPERHRGAGVARGVRRDLDEQRKGRVTHT